MASDLEKFKFYVGLYKIRTIEVMAENEKEARWLASEKLDDEAIENDEESPIKWDLILINRRKMKKDVKSG